MFSFNLLPAFFLSESFTNAADNNQRYPYETEEPGTDSSLHCRRERPADAPDDDEDVAPDGGDDASRAAAVDGAHDGAAGEVHEEESEEAVGIVFAIIFVTKFFTFYYFNFIRIKPSSILWNTFIPATAEVLGECKMAIREDVKYAKSNKHVIVFIRIVVTQHFVHKDIVKSNLTMKRINKNTLFTISLLLSTLNSTFPNQFSYNKMRISSIVLPPSSFSRYSCGLAGKLEIFYAPN